MAVYVRPYSEVAGQIARASAVNRYVDDFASTVNALNSANLLASAVGTTALEGSSVTTAKIADLAIVSNKLDGEIRLYQEVFS